MIGSARLFQIVAVGFGLALAVVVAPVKVGATDLSTIRPIVSITEASSGPGHVAMVESGVPARVAGFRMNLLGR